MKTLKIISSVVCTAMLGGCCTSRPGGPQGPELVSKGYTTESGTYAEVGVKFTNTGDLFALVNPARWQNPVSTGGSLSWINPGAWSEDAGRTGRIFLGEAAIIGGAVAGIAISSSGGDSGGGSAPTPPSGGGGTTPGGPPGP